MEHSILIADIGGTNIRFAYLENNKIRNISSYRCKKFHTPEDAFEEYIRAHKLNAIDTILIAAAGKINQGNVQLTNFDWSLRESVFKSKFKTKYVKIINDFESTAYSINVIEENKKVKINLAESKPKNDFNYAIIGPGTGLGIAGLLKRNNHVFSLATEGGNTGFSPQSELQIEILHCLQNQIGCVSNEKLLSGPGLLNIYSAICLINNQTPVFETAEAIGNAAKKNLDAQCNQTFDVFFEILGQVAGDTTLSLGAFDGVYLTGSILRDYHDLLLNSSFQEAFKNKCAHQNSLEHTPIYLITEEHPELLGLYYYANTKLSR